jgi:hypothetical protein
MRTALVMLGGLALLLAVGAVGCSTPTKPAQEIEKAELAIKTADGSPMPAVASLELRLAREKLERAKTALADEEYDQARRLAEQAQVDAQLAEAKADSEAARASAAELEQTINTLRNEAERAAGNGT